MAKYFISSTYSDLKDFRKAVADQLRKLGHDVLPNDNVAVDARPVDECLALVRSCDVYLGILAWSYGSVPEQSNPESISITELEWREAVKAEKDRLYFLLDPTAMWMKNRFDDDQKAIVRLRKKWSDDRWPATFKDQNELALRVTETVANHDKRRRVPDARVVRTTYGTGTLQLSNAITTTTFPGRLISITIGRFEYSRAAGFWHRVLEAICGRELSATVVSSDFKMTVQSRSIQATNSGITCITGPAGVGKSTVVSELVQSWKDRFDVAVVLRAAKLDSSSLASVGSAVETEIQDFLDNVLLSAPRRLTTRAISYALKSKRVLFIIEDLHHSQSAQQLLRGLREYMQTANRWDDGIKVLATTREQIERSNPAWHGVEVRELQPFERREAQALFWTLCDKNGVPRDVLSGSGQQLYEAFATEPVRTPLFVVLCAWLASTPGSEPQIEWVRRVLGMTAGEVFDHFIRALYQRSMEKPELYPAFRDLYERLALELWPEWDTCIEQDVASHIVRIRRDLEQVYPDISEMFGVGYLERNGFLFRARRLSPRLHFPHHSVADYLTAQSMSRHRDFSRLRGAAADMHASGLSPFLAEALRDWDSLLDLERASFGAFVSVLLERERRGAREVPDLVVARLAERIRSAAVPESLEPWLTIRDLLNRIMGRRWVANICSKLEEEPQSHGLELMAALTETGFDEYLRGVLCKPGGPKRIFEAIRTGALRMAEFLVRTLTQHGIEDEAARKAYRVLLQLSGREADVALTEWTTRYVERLTRGDFEIMARRSGGFRLLSRALAIRDRDVQLRMSRMVADATGKVVIPPGSYAVTENDKRREAVVRRGIVIPCENVQITVSISASPTSALPSRVSDWQLMTYSEALVALQHFKGAQERPGVLFNPSREDISEIFRQDSGGLAFYVIPNVEDRALAASSKTPGQTRTSYRVVEYLD